MECICVYALQMCVLCILQAVVIDDFIDRTVCFNYSEPFKNMRALDLDSILFDVRL